jgi:hypothetical protein
MGIIYVLVGVYGCPGTKRRASEKTGREDGGRKKTDGNYRKVETIYYKGRFRQ